MSSGIEAGGGHVLIVLEMAENLNIIGKDFKGETYPDHSFTIFTYWKYNLK